MAEQTSEPARAEQTTLPAGPAETRPARWDPFSLFDSFQEEMDRIWSLYLGPSRLARRAAAPAVKAWAPRMDVFEKDDKLVVKTELPGVEKEDIEVTLDRGDLEIRGHRKVEHEVKEENYYRSERSYGSFYRRMPLPFAVTPDQIEANYKDGVLEVQIPKPAETKPEAQKISVS